MCRKLHFEQESRKITMGCTNSVYKKKKKIVPEISIFAPILRIPIHSDLQRILRGFVPDDLADRIAAIRNQIALVGEDTGLVLDPIFFSASNFV